MKDWVREKEKQKEHDAMERERAMAEYLNGGGTVTNLGSVYSYHERKELKEFRKSREWRRVRKEFILENTHIKACQICDDPFPVWDDNQSYTKNDKGRSVDHIMPVSKDRDRACDKTNLQLLCKRCNSIKSDLTPEQFEIWEEMYSSGFIGEEKYIGPKSEIFSYYFSAWNKHKERTMAK